MIEINNPIFNIEIRVGEDKDPDEVKAEIDKALAAWAEKAKCSP